jgi:hypothetical protein
MFRDAHKSQLEWRKTRASLPGPWAAILAMRCGRAPLLVSPALSGLLYQDGEALVSCNRL